MIEAIIGKKLGATTIFDAKGRTVGVTVIEAGPVVVMQVKTPDKDGYAALQLGFGEKKQQRAKKPELGHARQAGTSPKRTLHEVRTPEDKIGEFKLGQALTVADLGLEPGMYVDVIGTSRGKGFQGVMKRFNFSGYDETHGTHEYRRHAGSIGTNTTPGRVLKGKKMPGHMGNKQVTMHSIEVVEIRLEQNLILIRGSAPGGPNGIVIVRRAKKKHDKKAQSA